ncbi:NAD-dependent epimerase/dehydratase family protein [Tropicimonas marinistellae]|uniref:NAD-dependent epimerase/dehydratase family protein n=1 Tax=Tropicimonas marinistellae TaxID=1739787 RepID=UPI00082FF3ED|nr:NAD(P)-dependent oxidoreductase [Tropicimonas marinistellae]
MRLAVTGGTGLVGRFVVEEALTAGDRVTVFGRRAPASGFFRRPVAFRPYDLSADAPDLSEVDALVHMAFLHEPGRYRGGEGNDADGFIRANLDGSLRLFEAARVAGVKRVLFLSSRAVYGAYPPGTLLREEIEPRPDTLYGDVKLKAERALAAMAGPGFDTASLRATGVYGPAGSGQAHKWQGLFADFQSGAAVAPRVATEVHGADLAAAVRLLLTATPGVLTHGIFNVSDLILDRHDLLSEVARHTGTGNALPPRGDPLGVSAMDTRRLETLGWRPGGMALLRASVPALLG